MATLTLSQLIARVFRDEDADDFSWSSMAVQTGGASVQWIPVRKEWPKGFNKGGSLLCHLVVSSCLGCSCMTMSLPLSFVAST